MGRGRGVDRPATLGNFGVRGGSYVRGRFSLALSLAWETFDSYSYDGSQYVAPSVNGGGFGLDVSYFWPINLETGSGYFGPRVYSYITCQSRNNAPLNCSDPRINPGFTVGVNLELGPEIRVFLLPPDEHYPAPRLSSPFSLSLSFRF